MLWQTPTGRLSNQGPVDPASDNFSGSQACSGREKSKKFHGDFPKSRGQDMTLADVYPGEKNAQWLVCLVVSHQWWLIMLCARWQTPKGRVSNQGPVDPASDKFSGFVFKLQVRCPCYFTQRFFQVVLQKATPPQIHRRILYYYLYKE